MSEKTALRDALSKLVAATNEGKTVTFVHTPRIS